MRPLSASTLHRCWAVPSSACLRPSIVARRGYATAHPKGGTPRSSPAEPSTSSRRRAVTPFNDDGRVPWTELSVGEKTARATQQTFNFGLVIVGIVLTGSVTYFLYTDVFAPDSKVNAFNRAVDRIQADPRCIAALAGDGSSRKDGRLITAFGEETGNKWRRARPIASTSRTDSQGDHLLLHFHVKGPRAQGTAYVHLVRRPGQNSFVYQHLYIDVPGHERIYLERPGDSSDADKRRKLFGINWS